MKKDEFIKSVGTFFEGSYDITAGRVIPDVADIPLGKRGTELDLAMMFIDIRESTKIVDGLRRTTAARMYKAFLWGVSKIARLHDGELRSFNGDGVLIAFAGETKRTNAAKAALQMSWFGRQILKPQMDQIFSANKQLNDLDFDFGIGVDVGKVLVVRGGIKGENNNDLVWVGNATNYAVKLSSIPDAGYYIFISEDVYKNMADTIGGTSKKDIWERRTWNSMAVYRSSYWWSLSN